jgi:SAM-dependent methyltransferase
MTMEHVHDPREIAQAAFRLLRPGGAFVTVTHDYRSWVNRLLGRRSPIIDIEHMQLFSRTSIRHLFEVLGYADISVRPFQNRYALRYWTRLLPLPRKLKAMVIAAQASLGIYNAKISFNVGNLMAVGFRPKVQ